MSNTKTILKLENGDSINYVNDWGDGTFHTTGKEHWRLGSVQQTNCCGIYEVFGFQFGQMPQGQLDNLVLVLKNWNKVPVRCAGFILNLVHSWVNHEQIKEALIAGGWTQVMDVTKNPNSGNKISSWMYRKVPKPRVRKPKVVPIPVEETVV